VIADLVGKRERIRTGPVPISIKTAINEWMSGAGITQRISAAPRQQGRQVQAAPLSGWPM
jgi:hypothetical protein